MTSSFRQPDETIEAYHARLIEMAANDASYQAYLVASRRAQP